MGQTRFPYHSYGGWMDHGFYFVRSQGIQDRDPLNPSLTTFADGYAVGDASGTNPVSGGSTWQGAMAGIDVSDSETEANLIEGDATVTIDDFDRPMPDIAFTNVRDANAGTSRSSMRWSDVALSGGSFSSTGLSGRFFGPNHEEVGGIFIRDQVSGSFGAKR